MTSGRAGSSFGCGMGGGGHLSVLISSMRDLAIGHQLSSMVILFSKTCSLFEAHNIILNLKSVVVFVFRHSYRFFFSPVSETKYSSGHREGLSL